MEKEEIDKYRESFLSRLKQQQLSNKKRQTQALFDLEKIKKYLIEEVGVKEIYLFGSIISDTFNQTSDIDLAVSGVKDEDFLKVYSKLDDFTSFNIELIDLDEKDDFLRQQIRKRGKKIYERG
ncbi:MAG: nucleotidyltransferase domain-containing protein [bacterium]